VKKRGFTLLEALIAIAILAGLMTAIFGVQASAIQGVRYARDLQVAALLARAKMLEIEWKLKKNGFTISDMAMEGDFSDAEAERFSWRAEIRRVKPEAFEQVALGAGGGSENPLVAAFAPAIKMIGQQLADQVREVRLWVRWKDGVYDESFDVVTHIVQLGAAPASPPGLAAPAAKSGSSPAFDKGKK
jgi:prepilin-type N-terminal cleavage/methylation domain-containing protein